MTPDITIRGRLPTQQEYRKHIELLEDLAFDEQHYSSHRVYSNWTGKDMSDLQHEVWIATARAGLMRQTGIHNDGPWKLTQYGKRYLAERSITERRDRTRRRRR